jgi:hypothetical protein
MARCQARIGGPGDDPAERNRLFGVPQEVAGTLGERSRRVACGSSCGCCPVDEQVSEAFREPLACFFGVVRAVE